MKNLRRLRKLLNDLLDELEAAILAGILKAALKRHEPVMFDVDHQGQPAGRRAGAAALVPWCLACVKHWPCDRWIEIAGLAEKLDIDGS